MTYNKNPYELIEQSKSLLLSCRVCPHQCGTDRLANQKDGECRTGIQPKVSSANLHFGEEPPISGHNGSGTIFFANCNLSCMYCQNYPISQYGEGREVPPDLLADLMLKMQKKNAHNVNFVTPSHVVPQIIESFFIAKSKGLNIPIVYNSSGFDSVETLKYLEGIVDIYMPDMRYSDGTISEKLSGVPDYPEINRLAIAEMHRQVGDLTMDKEGIAIRGLLIRHLVLPNDYSGSEKIFNFIAEKISKNSYISLMSQYFPAYKSVDDIIMKNRITKKEFKKSVDAFYKAGLNNGYIQPEPN
ncbi:MAG: radical SAM protein [candidate division Zixibacteria bacterium]|nr:radical SAM protein [candidate division Zixibacteria bacterium]